MIYKILLLALLVLLSIVRNDLVLTAVLAFTILFSFVVNVKLNIKLLAVVLLLFLIFITAFISSFFESPNLNDVLRDVWYLLKPILIIYAAYFITSKIKDKEYLFRAIIYIGIIAAVLHLLKVVPDLLGQSRRIAEIRASSGKGNIVEIFSFTFLFLNKEVKYFKTKNIKYALYALLLCSIIFYFSRTMLLLLFMVIFSMKGYLRLTFKSLKYLGILIIAFFVFFGVLNRMNLSAEDVGINGFLYKIKIAPSEIIKTDIDINNHRDLWDHFRAYEAIRAIETTNKNGFRAVVFGNGLGGLVDLDFEVKLSGKMLQFIPIIHNGYVFVFFKSGIIGLLLYLLLLFMLYLKVYNVNGNNNYLITRRLISTIGIYYFFTSLVITGMYNPAETIAVFLGAALFLETYFKKQQSNKNELMEINTI
ncbi:hypothetical protein [Olleya namhaensis]|uniref:O-Antigen ligase n=1 Tax=Olleya namhaensis TaxID=1144750 RepID=A0A1I3JQ60_9FLAO|nr:hypothetical protein [Olleya namhaensis]SFI62304.1 hypothetical protein SAMN05443431_101501 [Olleya namhaensis]